MRNLGRSNSSAPTAIHQLPVPIVGQRAHLAALLLAVFPPLIPADTRQVLDPLTRFLTFSSSRYQNAQQQNKTDVKKKVTRQVQVRMEQNTPVAAPQGFELVHDGLAAEVCRAIESWLILGVPLPGSPTAAAEIPWQTGDEMQSSRVAQFGTSKYDYENDIAVFCDDGPSIPIPAYLKEQLIDEVHHADGTDSVVEAEYTQCIINSYRADNEIPWPWSPLLWRKGPGVHVWRGAASPVSSQTPAKGRDLPGLSAAWIEVHSIRTSEVRLGTLCAPRQGISCIDYLPNLDRAADEGERSLALDLAQPDESLVARTRPICDALRRLRRRKNDYIGWTFEEAQDDFSRLRLATWSC